MDNLRLIIRKLIEEIEDEEIEEATVTGNVAGYNTPMAFTGGKGKGKKKKKKISTNSTGYKQIKEDINDKDLKLIKSVIRNEVADILKTIWLKRATWKQG
tara:strand:+ start:1756 stop:2055 length:300 start_codon:yes stop_codon:yes gene_type:complete